MHSQSGFSLVELSIVLVILGLLTGGILGGQSLIKAAELRAVTTEFQQWQTAVNTFKQKYFAAPGDFNKASSFWSGVANGNGDGLVATDATPTEHFLFWQHLAKAGLINGEYSGVAGSGGALEHILGGNCPKSRFGAGGWAIETRYGGNSSRFAMDYINAFLLGSPNPPYTPGKELLTPSEAWNVDTKMDDGRPGRGNIIAHRHANCTDAADENDLDSDYALGTDSVECGLYFRKGV